MRPTHAEIDLGAIGHNVRAAAEVIAPSTVCAVVKADAYGHGDVPVASTALNAGATMLAVALVEEGVRLREGGIDAPIMVLSEPQPHDARLVSEWGLEPTVYTLGYAEALTQYGSGHRVHVKVDTGMHRVGSDPEDVAALVAFVTKSPRLELASLWTHFASADDDPVFTNQQIEVFQEVANVFEPPRVHLANSAGAFLFPDARGDFCRIGLSLYGLHPSPETRSIVDLMPAMKLVTRVSHVRRLEMGARPSYGRVRALPSPSTVATAPIGYADGYARSLTELGRVLIRGNEFRLAGRVTMDQIVIDVGDMDVELGEEVVLLGRQGAREFSADDWANALGTISYEVVCSIGPRVPRVYV